MPSVHFLGFCFQIPGLLLPKYYRVFLRLVDPSLPLLVSVQGKIIILLCDFVLVAAGYSSQLQIPELRLFFRRSCCQPRWTRDELYVPVSQVRPLRPDTLMSQFVSYLYSVVNSDQEGSGTFRRIRIHVEVGNIFLLNATTIVYRIRSVSPFIKTAWYCLNCVIKKFQEIGTDPELPVPDQGATMNWSTAICWFPPSIFRCPAFHRGACNWLGPLNKLIQHVMHQKCAQEIRNFLRQWSWFWSWLVWFSCVSEKNIP